MNQKRTMFVLFVCLVTSLVGCGRRTLQNTLVEGNEYVLEFPDSWEIQSQFQGADMVGISPQESPDDSFRENVTVVLENMPASMTDQGWSHGRSSHFLRCGDTAGDDGQRCVHRDPRWSCLRDYVCPPTWGKGCDEVHNGWNYCDL